MRAVVGVMFMSFSSAPLVLWIMYSSSVMPASIMNATIAAAVR